jgi:L-ascorbate metabolism protein UlaG (beta-lactamase superfamily)
MAQIGAVDYAPVKILFDPLYDDHFGSLQQLPPELIEAIVSGAPPYDGVNAVFVSHAHGDHFSATHLTRMLASQPQIQLVAPGQAIDRMREDANWQPGFEDRVTAITLENGEAVQGIEVAGAYVEAFRSPHAGWPDRHAATHNITFRVSAANEDGRASARIMHLGDADPAAEHFAALSEFLSAKRTGLAAVPFWFYGEDGLSAIIDQTLNAQSAVAVHVPVNAPGYLEAGERPYFSGVGDVLEIPAAE